MSAENAGYVINKSSAAAKQAYLKLYRAGTLSVDQLDEIRRAGLGSDGRP